MALSEAAGMLVQPPVLELFTVTGAETIVVGKTAKKVQ